MLTKITAFKAELEGFYTNRLDNQKSSYGSLQAEELYLTERISSLALGIITSLAVLLTLGNQGWKNAACELFARVATGKMYLPLEQPPTRPYNYQTLATVLNEADRFGTFKIAAPRISQFLARGGHIEILEDGQQIQLRKNERYVVGCTSGVNRSQTHAAYLIKNGIAVEAILAGGDSAFNPHAEYPMVSSPYMGDSDEQAFTAYFGFPKRAQLGSELGDQASNISEAQSYYKRFVTGLPPTHFITYAMSGPSTLTRLLESNKPLRGYTITHIRWADQISHPPEGVAANSQEAYKLFEEKIAAHFPVVD